MKVDSRCVVAIIQRKETLINAHYLLVRDINRRLNRRWEVKIAHIYSESNRCVDIIANHALSLSQGLHILDCLPTTVRKIVLEDIMGISFPRSCIM